MRSDEELLRLYRGEEADFVERKESAADTDKIQQAICAFANDLPNHRRSGVVFVGQRNDGSNAGLTIDDKLLLRLGCLRDDGRILPFPTMHVSKRSFDGADVAVIEVEPSDNPPMRVGGIVWIRVGPRRAKATPEEERRLTEKHRWGNLPFDMHAVRGATVADLDLKRFQSEYLMSAVSPETLAENGRSVEQQLRALRFMRPDGTPTVTAMLFVGVTPQDWIPCAYTQFLRLDGSQLTDRIVDNKTLTGTLTDQLRRLDELVRINVIRGAKVGGPKRIDSIDYPEEALRQLVRNALMHRTYEGTNAPTRVTWFEDRVEIQTPGGPYGHVTRANFGMPGITDYRNPTIAEALRTLGFVERFGVGIQIAREQLQRNGNAAPEFIVNDEHIAVVIKRAP